jgi:hypothetical protein
MEPVMSVEALEADSDIYRVYDRSLSEIASRVEVAMLGPEFPPEDQPEVKEAVQRFLAGELVRRGHDKLPAQGVSEELLPDERALPRTLELDLLPEPDRDALEMKLRDAAAQTIRDPEGGGELPGGGEPGGPSPAPSPPPPSISISQIVGGSCIHAYSGIPGLRLSLMPHTHLPWKVGIVGWQLVGYAGWVQSGDGLQLIVEDPAPFRLQPTQMLITLASKVGAAKEIMAWNAVRGRLSSVFQPGPSTVPTTMLLTHDCEGADTIAFRAAKTFGFWVDLVHFDPNPFWSEYGGLRLAFTWITE